MKQLTKYNRVAAYLNEIYDRLNMDFFDTALERPVITIQSTPKAYGHFTLYDAWSVKGEGTKEINIGAGTLARPIENVIATLLHEMCHQYNAVSKIQDVSRGGSYHNKEFRKTAESKGLNISRSDKYGWSITEPADPLIEWILLNDLADIPMNRNEFSGCFGGDPDKGAPNTPPTRRGSSYRWYQCPVCGLIARTTKDATLVCGDCGEAMEEKE